MSQTAHITFPTEACPIPTSPSTQLLVELASTPTPPPNPNPNTTSPTPTNSTPINCINSISTPNPPKPSYSLRTRTHIKPPTAFPVAFTPRRQRTTKRIVRGYKNTANVKMPVKTKRNGVTKGQALGAVRTAESKAAERAFGREERRVEMTEEKKGIVDEDEDCEMGDVEMIC